MQLHIAEDVSGAVPAACDGRGRGGGRSADMEAAALGLGFAEMVLQAMPGGARAVEAADGIDAIESLQFRCP